MLPASLVGWERKHKLAWASSPPAYADAHKHGRTPSSMGPASSLMSLGEPSSLLPSRGVPLPP